MLNTENRLFHSPILYANINKPRRYQVARFKGLSVSDSYKQSSLSFEVETRQIVVLPRKTKSNIPLKAQLNKKLPG